MPSDLKVTATDATAEAANDPAVANRRDRSETIERDDKVRALQLRTSATGKRTWHLYFRDPKTGGERRPKLCDGAVPVTKARVLAIKRLAEIGEGKDPWEKVAPVEIVTLADAAERAWRTHYSNMKSSRDARRHLDIAIGLLGHMDIKAVDRTACQKLHDAVAAGKYRDKRSARGTSKTQAVRALATLSRVLELAERWEMRPLHSNPSKLVEHGTTQSRTRYVTTEEAPRIDAALVALEATSPMPVAVIRLAMLTGARLGELLAARWEHITEHAIELPDSKSGKPRTIYLSDEAKAIIAPLPRLVGDSRVFMGIGPMAVFRVWTKVRTAAGCPDLRFHDLRHTFASQGISAGLNLTQVGLLLGHAQAQTTLRYSHLLKDAGREAAAAASARVSNSLKGKK